MDTEPKFKQKLFNTFMDIGVLYSTLHIASFALVTGVASPAFSLAALSYAISLGFSAAQNKVIPNKFNIPKGMALTTNGGVLSVIAGLSILSGNIPGAIIGGLFSLSNTSKGLEMAGKPNLKTMGQRLLPSQNRISKLLKNTVFSSEFLASGAAFTIGFYGIGPAAIAGMALATGTLLTLSSSKNNIKNPTWHKIPAAKPAFDAVAHLTQKTPFIKTSFSPSTPVSDLAMSRYVMAFISASYATATILSQKAGFTHDIVFMGYSIGNEVLAVGHSFAAVANAKLGNFQRGLDKATLAQQQNPQPA